jgi:hypothetical protein
MNDSNFAQLRTLFLLPLSDVRRSALFGVVAMVLTLSACGSDTAQESLIEAFADVDGLEVDIDDDAFSYRVEGEDGVVVVGSGASLPSSFPDDIPIYEDAEIVTSYEAEGELMVQLSALGSAEAVMRAYQQSLEGAGWEATESTQSMAGFIFTTFEKGPRVVSVSAIFVDEENTLISLTTETG